MPVLNAIVQEIDDSMGMALPNLAALAESLDMDKKDVGRAAMALDEAGLIELHKSATGGDPGPWFVTGVSPEARRLVGQWPTPQSLADAMLRALEAAAANEPDPVKRTKLKQAAGTISSVARDVLVDVAAKVVLSGTGMG